MAKPDFFVAGQGKSGTTLVHAILDGHPEIFVPNAKETPFFSDETYAYGLPYLERQIHPNYAGQRLVGDCFSATMFHEGVPERIARDLGPGVKFIFSLRQPIARAIAHYNMAVRQLRETRTFIEAVRLESDRASLGPGVKQATSYIGRGYYARQIARFLKVFPREQMLFLVYEEAFGPNVEATARRIFDFLGVTSDSPFVSPGRVNESPSVADAVSPIPGGIRYLSHDYFRPSAEFVARANRVKTLTVTALDPSYEQALWRIFYADEVRELESLIGRELSLWGEQYDSAAPASTPPARIA